MTVIHETALELRAREGSEIRAERFNEPTISNEYSFEFTRASALVFGGARTQLYREAFRAKYRIIDGWPTVQKVEINDSGTWVLHSVSTLQIANLEALIDSWIYRREGAA